VQPLSLHQRRIATALTLAAILAVALLLRIYGLDWDRGFFFHPDERQILMVVDRLALPQDLRVLLTPASPLNPRFFAYGSLPIYLLRAASWILALGQNAWASILHFYLLGRILSAVFDTVTVAATFGLALKAFGDRRAAILSAALVALAVLHIQSAHFYTVDTLLALCIVLAVARAVDVARDGHRRDGVWLGAWVGAAMATKLSAAPLLFTVMVSWLAHGWPGQTSGGAASARLAALRASWQRERREICLCLLVAAIVFLLLEPYALIDAVRFGQSVITEMAMSQGWSGFPYTRQYAGTLRVLYQVRQMALFTLGPGLTLLGLAGLVYLTIRAVRRPSRQVAAWLSWPVPYALLQGASYAKFVRYALPLSPFLCIAAAVLAFRAWDAASSRTTRWSRRVLRCGAGAAIAAVLLSTAFYAAAFVRMHGQAHPWLQATDWICAHAPAGATLSADAWDDSLPVQPPRAGGCPVEYRWVVLDLHAPDSAALRTQLLDMLEACDFIALASDRLYAPLSRFPDRYPLASRYFQGLFAERLGFELVFAPVVYPNAVGVTLLDNPRAGLPLANPPLLAQRTASGLVLNLGRADESFTVYDHPQPLIFARTERLSRQQLSALLGIEP